MSDERSNTPSNVRNLGDAMRDVRTAEAERSDVVVELRDAERARLEILAEELRGVFDEVPAEDEQFIFNLASGLPPRLWIDMTSFVVMGRDRRTYRFLKDTRLGRAIILETTGLADMADTVTTYVAERIVERERALEGDWLMKRVLRGDVNQTKRSRQSAEFADGDLVAAVRVHGESRAHLGWLVAAFLAGALIGVLALFGTAWFVVG